MNTMTKGLIIGLSIISVTGATVIGVNMYAANTGLSHESDQQNSRMEMRGGMRSENIIHSLSGKVSTEALAALQTLMNKHKAEMDTARTSATQPTETELKTLMDAFTTEINDLLTKYPELKTAMANLPHGEMGRKHGMRQQNEIDAILAGISDADKTAIESIRTEYRGKLNTLRIEEKEKIDAIIAKYPEIKTKLDAFERSRHQMRERHEMYTPNSASGEVRQ